MLGLAAERYGEQPAVRYKRDGEWRDVSYRELGEIVSEIARGLIDLGLEPGDRVGAAVHARAPSGRTRTSAITGAGGVVVPIYPTNSPEECAWVAGNSESRFIVCEDAEQVAKIVAVRDQLPDARGDHRDRARRRAPTRSRWTSCASAAAAATPPRSPRAPRRSSPRTRSRSSTRPAPPARRRAACSPHGNYRDGASRCARRIDRHRAATSSTSTCRSPTPTRC